MSKLLKFAKLVKVEDDPSDGLAIAYCLSSSEAVDSDDERCNYDGAKPQYKIWSDRLFKSTSAAGQEPSLGNIRLMHKLEIAGKATGLDFDDDLRHIYLASKAADARISNMLRKGMIAGMSQGGDYLSRWCAPCGLKEDGSPKTPLSLERAANYCPVHKRSVIVDYVPGISEVSYVDSPANPDAFFSYVKSNGSRSMVKIGPAGMAKITKRVAGEDLPASAFAYVGDPDKTETWKLPIKFSTAEKTVSHLRNALSRFGQAEGIPAGQKASVKAKIVAAAKEHGITVSGEKAMTTEEVQEVIAGVLAKMQGGKTQLSKAGVHDHLKKAIEHHAKAMEHMVAAKRASEDGEDAGGHIEKAQKSMEMCHKCMGKAMEAMGHDVTADGVEGGAEDGEKNAEKVRKTLIAAGLEGEALEKAVRKATGQAEVVTAEAIGAIVEGKLAEMLKAMFGREDDVAADKDKPVQKTAPVQVQQTSRRVTKTEDNADNAELERLRTENAELKKSKTQVHDPEGAHAELVKNKGQELSRDEAFKMGIVK